MKINIAVLAGLMVLGGLAGTSGAQENADAQFITKAGSQASSVGSSQFFTGHVHIDPLFSDKGTDAPYSAAYVTFAPGARSFWHTHPTGQHLIVTHGTGWTATWEGDKTEIQAGDVVWCPPGIKHWHGATDTTSMTHMALTGIKDGNNVTWLEAVSDEQYLKPLE